MRGPGGPGSWIDAHLDVVALPHAGAQGVQASRQVRRAAALPEVVGDAAGEAQRSESAAQTWTGRDGQGPGRGCCARPPPGGEHRRGAGAGHRHGGDKGPRRRTRAEEETKTQSNWSPEWGGPAAGEAVVGSPRVRRLGQTEG